MSGHVDTVSSPLTVDFLSRKFSYLLNRLNSLFDISFRIDWKYGECDFDLELVNDEQSACQERIHYSVSLRAEFVDSSSVIEFAVASSVTATCSYCSTISLESSGMNINAEDLFVNDPGFGRFDNLFQCKFYTDKEHKNQILSKNLVNMGTKIYGAVEASRKLFSLIRFLNF